MKVRERCSKREHGRELTTPSILPRGPMETGAPMTLRVRHISDENCSTIEGAVCQVSESSFCDGEFLFCERLD